MPRFYDLDVTKGEPRFDWQEITVENGIRPGTKKRALVENRFRAYLLDGGFPEVQGLENEYRIRILQDYLDVVILRDLVERYRISNTVAFRYLDYLSDAYLFFPVFLIRAQNEPGW